MALLFLSNTINYEDRAVLAPRGSGGVFNFAADLIGMENLYVAPCEDEELYGYMLARITAAMCEHNQALVQAGADCVGIQGRMAGGRTTGPNFFRQFVQPYE